MTTTTTSGADDLPDAMHMAELLENPINVVCQKTAAAVLRHQHSELYRLHALAAGQATAAQQSGAKLNYSVLYVYASQHGIDYNSLCVAVQEATAQPAAQQGAAYAALPEPDIAVGNDGRALIYTSKDIVGEPYYTADQMRAFADATHTLRASHGQAPAGATELAEADRRAGEAERLLATCKEDVMRFEQVRSRMKYQWGAEQRVSFDEVWDEALALKKAAQAAPQEADSVQEDAACEAIEKVLALFPFNVPTQKFTVNNGPCLTADNDDEFYSVKRVLAFLTEIKTTLDAARKQGEKQ